MEKINLVELLGNCPSGMELDCALFNHARLEKINPEINREYPIQVSSLGGRTISLTKYGTYVDAPEAKCIIFPKGKTTWEGFVPPCKFKDGDVIFTCTGTGYNWISIFKQFSGNSCCTYMDLYIDDNSLTTDTFCLCYKKDIEVQRLATKEEKEELFQAIKDNGYEWNHETKTLEKLPKFKEGDILYCNANDDGKDKDMFKYIFIFDKIVDVDGTKFYYSHCHLFGSEFYDTKTNLVHNYPIRFATEEEREKLFQAIKDKGYKWNAETKALEKLIQPEFKVGDKVRVKGGVSKPRIIDGVFDTFYSLQMFGKIDFTDQDRWELVPNKFDINTLVPFESRVLVRHNQDNKWCGSFFSHLDEDLHSHCYKFVTTSGKSYRMCIPFEGNEHLIGKTNDCDECYKTWEKTGD